MNFIFREAEGSSAPRQREGRDGDQAAPCSQQEGFCLAAGRFSWERLSAQIPALDTGHGLSTLEQWFSLSLHHRKPLWMADIPEHMTSDSASACYLQSMNSSFHKSGTNGGKQQDASLGSQTQTTDLQQQRKISPSCQQRPSPGLSGLQCDHDQLKRGRSPSQAGVSSSSILWSFPSKSQQYRQETACQSTGAAQAGLH